MDVNAFVMCRENAEMLTAVKEMSAINVKRVLNWSGKNWWKAEGQSPYFISDLTEVKTTWHPIENIAGTSGGY